jgi:hypothetical protein
MRLASYTGQSYRDHLDEKADEVEDPRLPELSVPAGTWHPGTSSRAPSRALASSPSR